MGLHARASGTRCLGHQTDVSEHVVRYPTLASQLLRLGADITSFVNMISGNHQSDQPPDFFGGIIADPMGFGKTLAMISLVSTDQDFETTPAVGRMSQVPPMISNLTLVVVPPPSELL